MHFFHLLENCFHRFCIDLLGSILWIRDGFDSRLDSSVGGQVGSSHSDSALRDSNGTTNGHTQANNLHEVVDGSFEQSEANDVASNDREHNGCGTSDSTDDLGGNTIQDIDSHESNTPIEHGQEEVPDNVVRGWQCSSSIETVESRDGTSQNIIGNLRTTTAVEQSQEPLQNDANDHSNIQGVSDVFNEQSDLIGDESVIRELSDHADGNMLGEVNFQEFNSRPRQWQDRVSENEERDQEQADVEYNSLMENVVENTVEDQQETAGYEWSQELVENEDDQLEQVPEVWHDESGFQEAVQSWLEGPSSRDSDSVRPVDTFYFPDDDNAHNTELRELLSRCQIY